WWQTGSRAAMRRPRERSDLRSLERRSMYSICHSVDVSERLPRAAIVARRRYRWLDRRMFDIVGFLCLPALILAIVVMGSANLSLLLAFALAGLAFIGVFAYIVSVSVRDQ